MHEPHDHKHTPRFRMCIEQNLMQEGSNPGRFVNGPEQETEAYIYIHIYDTSTILLYNQEHHHGCNTKRNELKVKNKVLFGPALKHSSLKDSKECRNEVDSWEGAFM